MSEALRAGKFWSGLVLLLVGGLLLPGLRTPTGAWALHAQTLPDSLQADSSRTDTLRTPRADRLLPRRTRDLPYARLWPRTASLTALRPSAWQREVTLDSTRLAYHIHERIGQTDVRVPVTLDLESYRKLRLRQTLRQNWSTVQTQRQRQANQRRRGGLGVSIALPGGRQSAFTTIFGRPEVDLRVNGQANINAGFNYRKSDQQVAFSGRAAQLDPDFKQDLRLGITGTIGDKLRVNVNWDTNNQFDYQNQLRLEYTGYEDEIIQRIEAGNVMLQTPSQLIRGGQSLFGIKAQFQLGGLQLTTVASQQEGQANSLTISGGAQTTTFDLQPTDYDDGRHFFLAYYFRNWWEDALSDPPNIRVANGFERITEIEVWKLVYPVRDDENVRQVVALVDLGEPEELLTLADAYTRDDAGALPDNRNDRYDDTPGGEVDTYLRNGQANAAAYLKDQRGLSEDDFQIGRFKRLEPGRDYTYDEVLGYISLTQRLQENEALAIAFRYRAGGRIYQVGDFSSETGGAGGGQDEDRLVLKLLRPSQLRQPSPATGYNPAVWYLELRNLYRLPGRGINPEDFELEIYYQPPGKTAQKFLTELGAQRTLLQLLGLDRLNQDQAPVPDNRFDFLTSITIDPGEGLLIFPFLEPFGKRLEQLIEATELPDDQKAALKDRYVFRDLYTQKKENARRNTQHNVYRIQGSYKSAVQDFYDLQAYAGLVEGSVRVTSGGTPLQEGVDFVVDYQSGTVRIINPAYLTPGREIQISYEQNALFNLQKKTLLGLRADYTLGDNLALGATMMRLSQKSPVDKFRLGEEPISNMIWGFDGSFTAQPRWLTYALDALPLIQTKEPSEVSFSGEFAQLRPGHGETLAFERTRRELRDNNRDFPADELKGISYIDDFEGFETTFSLKQPGSWRLASPPDSIARYPAGFVGSLYDSLRTTWRGVFAWYQLSEVLVADLARRAPVYDPEAVRPVLITDVFPNRDVRGELNQTLPTLDVYFNPYRRGPYNYTTELEDFLSHPEEVWGGMMQRLPEGYTDFNLKNIEFIEFIFRPFPENPERDAGPDAKLYIDLGSISEDVIPNGKLNAEDGLSMTDPTSGFRGDQWSRYPTSIQNNSVDLDLSLRRTEDLGLDGLASYDPSAYPEIYTEAFHFRRFLEALDPNNPDPRYRAERARALRDPSGDDYHSFDDDAFFRDPELFPPELYPNGVPLQERFAHYFPGLELNAYETQNQLATNASVRRGNSRIPDTEDLNFNASIDTDNSYFEYEIPLSKAVLDSLARPDREDDYIVGAITNSKGETWYQVRIPVRNYTRRVGNIQDFSLIESIRVWTTGHRVPITLRFATFELVGSQWRKAEEVAVEEQTPSDTLFTNTRVSISSVNNEENPDIYRTPNGAIISQVRTASGVVRNAREQALVLRVENLFPGHQRGIYKTFTQGLDLLKYSNLRMFVHLHGRLGDGTPLEALAQQDPEAARQKVRLFVRLGSNASGDYYEYEQPLMPSSVTSGNSDELWQTFQRWGDRVIDLNSVNILLGALNELKIARDAAGFPADSVFWNEIDGRPTAPGVPDADEFAPPGTRLAVKGNPSLGRITMIIIGVRNPAPPGSADPRDRLEEVVVWLNELRVSGYDEKNGYAAVANLNLKLADLGRVRANFRMQTDGFGSLSSTLGEREQTNQQSWSIATDFNLDRLLPRRYGWSIPFSLQLQSSTATPRFDPARGDVRVEEVLNQIERDSTRSRRERELERQEVIERVQTHSFTRSYSFRIQKQGSRSWLMRTLVDGLSFSYAFAETQARSPTLRFQNSWRWNAALSYRLNIRRPRTVRPFWFLDDLPLVGLLGDLRFNYLPQSLSWSGNASRNFSGSQDRPAVLPGRGNPELPDLVANPIREQHSLAHSRTFSLQYNPFTFLNLSFDTNTRQSLNAISVDTVYQVVLPDTVLRGLTMAEALERGLVDSADVGVRAFEQYRLQPVPVRRVMQRILDGAEGLRTDNYQQRFTAVLRPNLRTRWLQLQDLNYTAQFSWQNGSIQRNTGASVSNQASLSSGLTLRPRELWRKFEFYRKLEEQERQSNQRRRQPRTEEAEDKPKPLIRPPNPIVLLRRLFLAVTGIENLQITGRAGWSSASSNVGRGPIDSVQVAYSLLDALRGRGPSVGYRFGLDRRVDLENRVLDPSLQVADALSNDYELRASTALQLSPNLQVSLNWNVSWNKRTDYSYRPVEGGGVDTTMTERGTSRASIWAFGASYLELFRRQLDTYRRDLSQAADPTEIGDENGDGRVALTNASVVADFRRAFMHTPGLLGTHTPIPLPGWQLTYSGLSNWPLFRRLAQSVTVRHGYSADYSADYRTNLNALVDDPEAAFGTFALGGRRIRYRFSRYEVSAVRINERYQPLIGLDITWKNRLQTNLAWSKSRSYSLSTNNEVNASATGELAFTLSYQVQGLRIPFLPIKRLNNRVGISLNIARSSTEERRFSLFRAMQAAADDPEAFDPKDALSPDFAPILTSWTRTTIAPQISYQFSNRVSASFQLRYERFESADSRVPSSTTMQGGFNIRVSISN